MYAQHTNGLIDHFFMHCDIYKASTRDEMYAYIARPNYPNDTDTLDPLAVLPEPVRKALGRPKFVMHLDLAQTPKLARVPIGQVLESLQSKGFFLQLPPDGLLQPNALPPEGLRGA